jgi:F0F1-type ATP synthase epsilon subunit
MEKEFLEVKVFCSPALKTENFVGMAEAVSSKNRLGNFDILPRHINFISLIFDELTIHTLDKRKIIYKFQRGVLETSENKVRVFLGI